MKFSQFATAVALTLSLSVLVMAFSSSSQARPGWSQPAHGDLSLTTEQRNQIANLRGAFHDQIKALDWSVQDGGHDPATLQQTRELRLALRAEIRELLTAEQLEHMDSAHRRCPGGDKPGVRPVRQQTTTLYL